MHVTNFIVEYFNVHFTLTLHRVFSKFAFNKLIDSSFLLLKCCEHSMLVTLQPCQQILR